MYCERCGKEIADTDKFCEFCGAPQEVQHSSTADTFQKAGGIIREWIAGHKKVLIFGAMAVVLAVAVLLGIDFAKTFINPVKYMTVELSGYNTQGKAKLQFDEEDELLLKLLGEKADALDVELDEDSSEEAALMVLASYFQLAEEMDRIDRIFTLTLETEGEEDTPIKNGDSITAVIAVDREALKNYGFRTTKDSFSKTYVVGKDTPALPEPTQLDIFSVLDLVIDGADGYGLLINNPVEKIIPYDAPIDDYHSFRIHVEMNDRQAWQPYVRFTFHDANNEQVASNGFELKAEKVEGFASGEQVVVSVSGNGVENLSRYGLILTETQKTVTASGLRGNEEIDLLGTLEYTFGGSDGYGYIQITPGTYKIPVQNSASPDKELTVEVTEDRNYDVYKDYNGRPNVPMEFVVHPTANVESKVHIVVYAEPYDDLKNGDTVKFGIYESPSRDGIKKLNAAGFSIKAERTAEVSGLVTPVKFNLSDIMPYSVEWDEEEKMTLVVGTTKVTELPENALGIKQFVTTLGEKDPSYHKYPLTITFTATDAAGKEETHTITDDIYIQKDSWYNEIKFDVVTERSLRELRDYGIVIDKSYEILKVSPKSE